MKRFSEIALSITALVLLSPLLIFCAAVISMRDGWPFWFLQTRIGLAEAPFRILKLRTMLRDASLTSDVSTSEDPRVLYGCAWMRRYKIDELPQLLNVVLGDMSLVGPRPTTMSDVQRMSAEQRKRHSVKPGITGLAQINGDTSISWPARIQFDLEYISEVSLRNDAMIIVKTIGLIFKDSFNVHPTDNDEWQV
jgi:undecaprenyl phosphate N,N'-diacetylbacillosamine 1-phosphate transferase